MSNNDDTSFTTIADISETIRNLLEVKLKEKFSEITVSLDSPKKIEDEKQTTSNLLSVYLYRISENSDLKNQPAVIVDKDKTKPAPLSLDLNYMITPYGLDEKNKLAFLGCAMQILYDNPVLSGMVLKDADIIKTIESPPGSNIIKDTDNLRGSSKQIKISYNPLTQETITQIWQALEASMRISVFYLVTPIEINSTRAISGKRIIERTLKNLTDQ